jgi:alpha/beta superfamily hydrolase
MASMQMNRSLLVFPPTLANAFEEPLRLRSGPDNLHGMLHHPVAKVRGTVLLCTPDGEERAWSHRTYVQLARTLAHRGYAALRFEYAGHGESSGTYEETTVETRLNNIAAAAQYLADQLGSERFAVVASRLGAAFALEAAARGTAISHLALWEPVFDIPAYVRNLIRINLTGQMVIHKQVVKTTEQLLAEIAAGGHVSANGYHLTQQFLDGTAQLHPRERLRAFAGRVLIVTTPSARPPESSAEIVRLPLLPFWKEPKTDMTVPRDLIAETCHWIDRQWHEGSEERVVAG